MTGPRIHIDLNAITANWRMLADRCAPANAAAVVKADAYGTGAVHVGPALVRAGCSRFYVAWVDEGVALREVIGPAPEIAVFHGLSANNADLMIAARLSPVLNTLEQIHLWTQLGDNRPAATIHLDSGMNRLGVSPSDWAKAATLTKGAQPSHVMSHLACADEPDNSMNRKQLSRFLEGAAMWPGVRRSLSSTGGIYLGHDFALEETRPGIGLYGGGPLPVDGPHPVPVMRVSAPILQIRNVEGGETSGYGATWTSPSARTLATVGLGYADGFLRAATNKGHAVLAHHKVPIVGRVSMDMIVLDITGISAAIGDDVEVWGPDLWIGEQADAMSTIDYELLTRIGGRAERIYSRVE